MPSSKVRSNRAESTKDCGACWRGTTSSICASDIPLNPGLTQRKSSKHGLRVERASCRNPHILTQHGYAWATARLLRLTSRAMESGFAKERIRSGARRFPHFDRRTAAGDFALQRTYARGKFVLGKGRNILA